MADRAIIFDLDGTLVETSDEIWRALNHVLETSGRAPVPLEQALSYVGHGSRILIERGFRATGAPVDPAILDGLVARFIAFYESHIGETSRPYPGLIAFLERCQREGIKMAVCTNKFEGLSVKLLAALGMSHFFGAIIGPDTIGIRKPDPRPYREALSRMGAANARSLMIGDSETDILTARAAGVPVIAVPFGYTPEPVASFKPDAVVGHYDEMWVAVQTLI
jgi:phosphoglycolate phosphatase